MCMMYKVRDFIFGVHQCIGIIALKLIIKTGIYNIFYYIF